MPPKIAVAPPETGPRFSWSWIAPLITFVLLAAALWAVHSEIAHLHWADIRAALSEVRTRDIGGALAGAAASYLILTFNEVMGLHYAGVKLPYRSVAMTSFVSYAFAHNIGLSLLTGGSIRYRLYAGSGVSVLDVAAITGFCGATFVLGTLAAGGLSLLAEPSRTLAAFAAPQPVAVAAGVLALALCAAYVAAAYVLKAPLKIGPWQFMVPKPSLAIGQIVIGTLDIVATASVAFFLLPDDAPISFGVFAASFVLAMTAGALSHLPGGIGVFEAVMLILLPQLQETQLLAALLAYRMVYYIVPLLLAASLWAVHETTAKPAKPSRVGALLRSGTPAVGAPLVGLAVFMGGCILLLSGATPALPERIEALRRVVPLPFIEASHLLASVCGFLLLLVARGLFRRLSGAYYLTALALASGAVFSLLKGFDYEEALVCCAILAILFASRRAFYRQSALLTEPLTPNWLISIAVVIAGVTWVGFFEHRNLAYSGELWTTLAFSADAPRFLRASLAIAFLAIGFGVLALMGPPRPRNVLPGADDLERARAIVATSPETNAHLALLGDKSLLFSASGKSFIMYGVRGRSWVALGNPVGPKSEWRELLWAFRNLVDRYNGRIAFYQVDAEHLPLYLDLGLGVYKLGEEAILPIDGFTLEGSARKELRGARNKGEREGLSFEILPPESDASVLNELKEISDEWLKSREGHEKGFSVGSFNTVYLATGPIAVARREGRIVAFANLLEGAGQQELSVDLMRHRSDAPPGTMDYLFVELLLWGASSGFRHFNFGMSPLSGLSSDRLAPLWSRIGNLIFVHSNRYYNFLGLRRYKDKFNPHWRPKYLAAPGGLAVPKILIDTAALVSGSVREVFAK